MSSTSISAAFRSLLASRIQPACMNMVVNAGGILRDSWVHDPAVGGGRIIGEACHWIDVLSYLVGAPVTCGVATPLGESPGLLVRDDKMTTTFRFTDGSIGTLNYFANGHKSYPKETLDVFCGGRVLRLNNFRILQGLQKTPTPPSR